MSALQHSDVISGNRDLLDRRQFSWRTVLFGFFRSRRHTTRRDAEAEPLYTDWHHPWLFFLATGIMLLSCLDAFMTLQLLDRGAVEMNPVMDSLIGRGTTQFAVVKMSLTGVGILTLVLLSRARFLNRMRTGLVLTGFFAFYACLVCYEFVTLLRTIS